MNSAVHHIRNFTLEVQAPQGDIAVLSLIEDQTKNRLLPQLSGLFDQRVEAGKVTKINNLELEVTIRTHRDWQDTWVEEVLRELSSKIKEQAACMGSAFHPSGSDKPKNFQMDVTQSHIEAWFHFLQYGYLPWWEEVTNARQYEQLILTCMEDSIFPYERLFTLFRRTPQSLQRLHSQFSADLVEGIFIGFCIHRGDIYQRFFQRLHRLIQPMPQADEIWREISIPRYKVLLDNTRKFPMTFADYFWRQMARYSNHPADVLHALSLSGIQKADTAWEVGPDPDTWLIQLFNHKGISTNPAAMNDKMAIPARRKNKVKASHSRREKIERFLNERPDPDERTFALVSAQVDYPATSKESNPDKDAIEVQIEKTSDIYNKYNIPSGSIYIQNAGLVLIAGFLPVLFENLALVKGNAFIHAKAQQKAIWLLHYLAWGGKEGWENDLPFNKILCGLPIQSPVYSRSPLSKGEKKECDAMLTNVIDHWAALKGGSIEDLRENFLQRFGRFDVDNHNVTIESNAIDILLTKLPWPLNIIKLPWNNFVIYSSWEY